MILTFVLGALLCVVCVGFGFLVGVATASSEGPGETWTLYRGGDLDEEPE